eukprot:gene16743-biopygen2077
MIHFLPGDDPGSNEELQIPHRGNGPRCSGDSSISTWGMAGHSCDPVQLDTSILDEVRPDLLHRYRHRDAEGHHREARRQQQPEDAARTPEGVSGSRQNSEHFHAEQTIARRLRFHRFGVLSASKRGHRKEPARGIHGIPQKVISLIPRVVIDKNPRAPPGDGAEPQGVVLRRVPRERYGRREQAPVQEGDGERVAPRAVCEGEPLLLAG